MRIRLQLLLPLTVGLLILAVVLLAALTVGSAVRSAPELADPGVGDAAARTAARTILVWGALAAAAGVIASAVIARMIVAPLARMREAAQRLSEPDREPGRETAVAEIQDVARGISRAAGELRDRHGRELRERSELASLVEAVSEGILQLGPSGRVVRCNRAARRLLGLPDDVVGHPIGSLIRHAELRRLLRRAADGRVAGPIEVVLDDRRILVSAVAQPEGGAVTTFVDLTDLRRLEEVRRDFVANASHELKTPLTSIRGYTETLLGGELPAAEQGQFLETIARNAERLQHIVDDLLDLSRLESGRWQPDLEPVDVLQLAERCWLTFAERAAGQGVAFEADSAEDAPVGLVDPRALEQVFANLYDNALRYTPAKGRVHVRTHTSRSGPDGSGSNVTQRARASTAVPRDTAAIPGGEDGLAEDTGSRWLVVDVTDTGAGIPRDVLPRIFERFYRADPARSRAEGGTGLGLSIVKHMIESMGGSVTARSELGKGTTIRLWLPSPP